MSVVHSAGGLREAVDIERPVGVEAERRNCGEHPGVMMPWVSRKAWLALCASRISCLIRSSVSVQGHTDAGARLQVSHGGLTEHTQNMKRARHAQRTAVVPSRFANVLHTSFLQLGRHVILPGLASLMCVPRLLGGLFGKQVAAQLLSILFEFLLKLYLLLGRVSPRIHSSEG